MLELISPPNSSSKTENIALREIEQLNERLMRHFKKKIIVQPTLTRPLVSFQANKTRPVYRWYKYKEAFSASLVEHFLNKYNLTHGKILDPFAGSGTALFVASEMGLDADGIELLPIGQEIISTKKLLDAEFMTSDLETIRRWANEQVWEQSQERVNLAELRITKGAYPSDTQIKIEQYLAVCQYENPRVQIILRFALLCVLESISFTRKDGQYLRWDRRAGRSWGKKPFDKGEILSFEHAIADKINEILADLAVSSQPSLFPTKRTQGKIRLYDGSCLNVLPQLSACTYDAIFTSPPYCNRYDYTRTYALELALLGTDEQGLLRLRQEMLSCTVENRAKDLLKINPAWATAITAADDQKLLQTILCYLDEEKAKGRLNNAGIPRMVRGYFYEMACVIAECARVLKPNALFFMVNDNVRYAGASISVDLILSDLAENLGLQIENILVLPNGKGNSSQQMGEHGRETMRKCVYVWRKA